MAGNTRNELMEGYPKLTIKNSAHLLIVITFGIALISNLKGLFVATVHYQFEGH